jgi:hypothetical protein
MNADASSFVSVYEELYGASSDILFNAKTSFTDWSLTNVAKFATYPLDAKVPVTDVDGNFMFNTTIKYDPANAKITVTFTDGTYYLAQCRGVSMEFSGVNLPATATSLDVALYAGERVSAADAWLQSHDPAGTYMTKLRAYNDSVLRNARKP